MWVLAGFVAPALCADPATVELGQKEEASNCIACHSVRIIHSQRLTKAAWNRELDKMAGWGAPIENREAVLEYLVSNFGDDKAPPALTMTRAGNGNPTQASH
jgi:mono/diheme cytochrome c family protein